MIRINETPDGIVFSIHVQPRASKNELCGEHDGALKVRLTSPPVEGAANKLCVEFFAKLLGVAKSKVSIISGEKSRHKTIRVAGASRSELLKLLESAASP